MVGSYCEDCNCCCQVVSTGSSLTRLFVFIVWYRITFCSVGSSSSLPFSDLLQLADTVTSPLFQNHALCTAIATAMYGLGATGFGELKMLAALSLATVLLKMDTDGFSVDTLMDNKVQTVVALVLMFIAYVN